MLAMAPPRGFIIPSSLAVMVLIAWRVNGEAWYRIRMKWARKSGDMNDDRKLEKDQHERAQADH